MKKRMNILIIEKELNGLESLNGILTEKNISDEHKAAVEISNAINSILSKYSDTIHYEPQMIHIDVEV